MSVAHVIYIIIQIVAHVMVYLFSSTATPAASPTTKVSSRSLTRSCTQFISNSRTSSLMHAAAQMRMCNLYSGRGGELSPGRAPDRPSYHAYNTKPGQAPDHPIILQSGASPSLCCMYHLLRASPNLLPRRFCMHACADAVTASLCACSCGGAGSEPAGRQRSAAVPSTKHVVNCAWPSETS